MLFTAKLNIQLSDPCTILGRLIENRIIRVGLNKKLWTVSGEKRSPEINVTNIIYYFKKPAISVPTLNRSAKQGLER